MSSKAKKGSSSKEKKTAEKSKDKTKDRDKSKEKEKKESKKDSPPPSASSSSSPDFEAGVIFNKYDPNGTGHLNAAAFRQMWSEAKALLDESKHANSGTGEVSAFDAGTIFAKFDSDNDGQLNKQDFEAMLRSYPDLLQQLRPTASSSYSPHHYGDSHLPYEVVSGRLLTHYDETAGIAISRSAVQSHEAMGNSVVPLVESYNQRYSRLRTYLTSKLLPRRENLLQLRRQLVNADSEVESTRENIERETMSDVDKIIERLRNVASMRHSAIQNQMLHIDEELNNIEKLVRRVEVANDKGRLHSQSGVTVTSSSVPPENGYSYSPHVSWKGIHNGTGGTKRNAFETVNVPRADLMVELIQQYSDLVHAIEAAATKHISVQVDFPTDDFPKETAERLEVISRCDKYSHALSVKDHMLWLALQDKERCEELLEQEKKLSSEYANEVVNWADLSQNLKEKLYDSEMENSRLQTENQRLMELLRQNGVYIS